MPPTDPNALPASYLPTTEAERLALTTFVRETPLLYGTWGRFKRLYKNAEMDPLADAALFGALAARLDAVSLFSSNAALPIDLGANIRGVTSLAVSGRRVYCLLGHGREMQFAGFEFDAENLLKPILLGSGPVSNGHSLLLCGPFVGLLGGGLESGTFSVFDPSRSAWRGQIALGGFGQAAVASPLVYVAVHGQKSLWSGLRIVDLTDPDHPHIIGEVEIKEAQHVAQDGGLAAVISGETRFRWGQLPSAGGLSLIKIADPRRPRLLGSLPLPNPAAVALRGSLAFVGVDRNSSNGTPGLHIIDVSNPARPQKRGFLATRHYPPQAIKLYGDFAYLTLQYGPAQIVNISNPDSPTVAGEIHTYSAADIAIAEDTAYVGTSYQGIELYSLVNPAKPARIGTPPSGATLGYMKRRLRRTLRGFAKTNSDSYVQMASEILAAARPEKEIAFDATRQWVLADILYGGSDRYRQARHGRGPLAPTAPARRRLRTREERAPEAWDRHPETVTALLRNPVLPWPVHEAMLKILLANDAALPAPSLDSLAAFVASPSPLLIHAAVPLLTAQLESGAALPPHTAAMAYVKTGAKQRRIIEAALDRHPRSADWNQAFAGQVLDLVSLKLADEHLPRRYASACETIARRFPTLAPDSLVRAMAAALLNAERPGLTELVLTLARRVSPPDVQGWLQTLQSVSVSQQEWVLTALAESLRIHAFTLSEAQTLVLYQGSEFERMAGWRLLAASATGGAVFQTLWTTLLNSPQETPALRTAMTSPDALAGLTRAGLSPQTIAERLHDRPFLAALLLPPTFAAILPTIPPTVALSLIAAVSDDRWADFRPALLNYLRARAHLAAFWSAVPSILASEAEGRLEQRLLQDVEIADTFTGTNDFGLLSVREPAFDAILGRWARAREAAFAANSPLLLQAAIHVLPTVRTWALGRVRALGLDLPFALRLLESSLPASLEVGSAFFTSLTPGDKMERGHALALCDSPLAPVRALGRSFVTARWETLPQEDLLRALFENSHPDMQAFVAELLSRSSVRPAETVQFDGEVLRTRHVARRAKEQVKARQSTESTVDVPTLLALARSRTPRDSEWALGQLAKLALAGQEIEGFVVTGTAGG